MKKFFSFFVIVLSFIIAVQPLSAPLASAKEANDNDLIDDAISGEDFNWEDVTWEYIEESFNNDEEYIYEEDENFEDYEYVDLEEGENYGGFDFEIINEDDLEYTDHEIQPFYWVAVARTVLSGGKIVVKFGNKVFKKQPASKAVNHTKNFQAARVNIGSGNTVSIQRSSMNHVLQRHHPKYWTGDANKILFNPNLTSSKLRAQMITIINNNKSKINKGYGTINVSIDKQPYRLVVSNYRVTTFYPVR